MDKALGPITLPSQLTLSLGLQCGHHCNMFQKMHNRPPASTAHFHNWGGARPCSVPVFKAGSNKDCVMSHIRSSRCNAKCVDWAQKQFFCALRQHGDLQGWTGQVLRCGAGKQNCIAPKELHFQNIRQWSKKEQQANMETTIEIKAPAEAMTVGWALHLCHWWDIVKPAGSSRADWFPFLH